MDTETSGEGLDFDEVVRLPCEYRLAHTEPSLRRPYESTGYNVHTYELMGLLPKEY